MKQLIMLLIICVTALSTKAQTQVDVKKTSTPVQKVHNSFSRHKHYKGYKVKRKYSNGHKRKTRVNTTTGEVEVKHN